MIWANRIPATALAAAAAILIAAAAPAARADETTVRLGAVRSITSGVTAWASARGYFKEAGIKLDSSDLDTSANSIALLSQNQLDVIEGGIAAGYFNGLEKELSITMVMDRVSTPIGHNLMLRPDLKGQITKPEQLKGKVIATNGNGSVSTYEIGKLLALAGLSINDVDLKVLPFPQYAVAFANKAIDAGLVIPPFGTQYSKDNVAVPFLSVDELIKPTPMTIAVAMINTDWAKKSPELARNFFVAYLRGVRDYCQAYHGGSIRADFIDLVAKTGIERRPEILNNQTAWPARSPDGRINTASMMDMQAWYTANKMSTANFSAERVVDSSYADYAVKKLGPFVLENKASTLPGCR
ncbi:MAG TPA: ABC transporter substrate-binding protein [Xanthobacteraceae bacterium]|jgi:NitT/TauT family transport system substrate-binding protein|nr:ABC transporter substrate-binding protein [Xanthobacteraceae bacterium]